MAAPRRARWRASDASRRPHGVDARRVEAALQDPSKAATDAILQLQRSSGNRAVRELLRLHGMQASLRVGAADDLYEQEADRVADSVAQPMATSTTRTTRILPAVTPVAQRHSLPPKGDEEDTPNERPDEALQRSAVADRGAAFEAPTAIEGAIHREAGGGRRLDPELRTDMEARFGTDFSGVRVHDGSTAVQLNRAVDANAFTRGEDIFFASKPDTATTSGRHLVAHELTHVVQQRGGRAGASVQRDNVKRGKALPDFETEIGKRIGEAMSDDAEFKLANARFQIKALEQALGDTSAPVVQAFTDARSTIDKIEAGTSQLGPLKVLDALTKQLQKDAPTGMSKPAVKDLVKSMTEKRGTGAAREYLRTERRGTMKQAYLSKKKRDEFATALMGLATVQSLLNGPGPLAAKAGSGTAAAAGGQPAPRAPSQWSDGLDLKQNVKAFQGPGIPGWMHKRRESSGKPKFEAKIDAVDKWLRALIEPEILRRVRRPNIEMYTQGRRKFGTTPRRYIVLAEANGFRPRGGKGFVKLAYDERIPLIAHELGHAIEGYLPVTSWHDMNVLLEKRHEDKVGSKREARTGATWFTSGIPGSIENEGRYAGSYATGKYTSTAYEDANETTNAEVFSQALEFFAKPSDARKLIEKDPLHAAIILRAIIPKEYANGNLDKFKKYLPS